MAAELPSHPLTFKNWKRVQIHDSRTEVVELSQQIQQLMLSLSVPENSSESEQKKIAKQINKHKSMQQVKLENLQYSKQLNFEDYFDVYLSKFSNDKKALAYIAKRLSKDSVAYLLERSMSKKEATEVKPPVQKEPTEIK